MNLSFFIARRIAKNRGVSFSGTIIRLATIGTALSVAIMILTIGLVDGFKKSIERKLLVFENDFHITTFNPNSLVSQEMMLEDKSLEKSVLQTKGVKSISPYASKPAILKGNGPLTGLRMKGLRNDFPFVSNSYIEFKGGKIDFSKDSVHNNADVLLSPEIIDRLDLKIGDPLYAYFVNEDNSGHITRKLRLAGSFHTGVGEIDNSYALCDIRFIQYLNKWEQNQISGYQVAVSDYKEADSIADLVYREQLKEPLITRTTREMYADLFAWLGMLNINAKVLLFIMAIVAVINIATALLIFILERTHMIATFKALGMKNWGIQKVFLVHASSISLRGIIIGNVIAWILYYLQTRYQFITLDENVYYMKYAPINWNWWYVLIINIATLALCYALMIIPSYLVRKVNIVKALRFE